MGLLDFDKLSTDPYVQMGLGLLANSYAPTGMGTGAIMGKGAMQGLQNVQQAKEFQTQQSIRDQQMAEMKRKQAEIQAQQQFAERFGKGEFIKDGVIDRKAAYTAMAGIPGYLPNALQGFSAMDEKEMEREARKAEAQAKRDADARRSLERFEDRKDLMKFGASLKGSDGGVKAPAGYRYTANGDLETIPGGPADVKVQTALANAAQGASGVDVALSGLRDAYDRLEKGGGITSTKKSALDNSGAWLSSSGVGQAVGKMVGTENQSARNDIAMQRPALLASLMKATGMSAKQMDSNAELKLWLSTATDPTLDVESNRKALDNIEKKYLKPVSAAAPAGATTPTAAPKPPMKGQVVSGYKFKGGDPADKNNWVKQ